MRNGHFLLQGLCILASVLAPSAAAAGTPSSDGSAAGSLSAIRGEEAHISLLRPDGWLQEQGGFEEGAFQLILIDLVGAEEDLEVTPFHPIFSADRCDWIPANQIKAGERLTSAAGAVQIEGVRRVQGTWEVHNLEVVVGATYRVGALGVLVHNDCDGVLKKAAKGVANLTGKQAKNLGRFNKKLPKGSTGTHVDQLGDGFMFTAEVPGRVPGSKAVYQKAVDASGVTTSFTKTTFDPLGNIIHVKDKLLGGG